MRYSLLREHKSLRGEVAFHDTGRTFEADDPHAYLVALQEKDGCSYAAMPAQAGPIAAIGRAWRIVTGGKV
jgi:hypothetical protein